jgi:hypothetical protein
MSRQEFIDKYLNKTVSKTLMITLIATVALFTSKLNGWEWTIIATAYIGSEKFSKTILMLRDKI